MVRILLGGAAICVMVVGLVIGGGQPAVAVAKENLPLISYDAFEFGFRGPDRLDPGMVSLQVVNTGKHAHQMQLVRLEEGHTAADFAAEVKAEPRASPPAR